MAGVAIVLLALPFAGRLLPVDDTEISAAALLARVHGSTQEPYSGYVVTTGAIQLAVGERFDDVGALLGEQTRLRVWWRNDDAWRVDRLGLTGETDLLHVGGFTTSYDYEDAKAVTSEDPPIRLPRAADLLPPMLARTVLTGITDAEVSRRPARTVAGIAAPGLRIEPAAPETTIDHVDLWADPATGLPLRVEVYADGATAAAFTSELRDFTAGDSGAGVTSFHNPGDVEEDFERALDIADAANQYAPFVPPDQVAGLTKETGDGAVGVYGRGVTRFIAIPLRSREGDPLFEQVDTTVGRVVTANGVAVRVGPLTVLVAGAGSWVLAGTVGVDTLDRAAGDVLGGTRLTEETQ